MIHEFIEIDILFNHYKYPLPYKFLSSNRNLYSQQIEKHKNQLTVSRFTL